jgi:hypothetical protein
MSDYCVEDFETYSRLFELKAEKTVELMRILDQKISDKLDMPTMRPKDLFRMVMDMGYEIDRLYKKEKNIEEAPIFIETFFTQDETISKMRTMLQDELKRYLGEGDE